MLKNCVCGRGSLPNHAGGDYSAPQAPSCIWGKRREWARKAGREGRKREVKGKESEEREGGELVRLGGRLLPGAEGGMDADGG